VDWESEQVRVKVRIEAAQARIEQLRLRREELAVAPISARGVDAVRERLRLALQRATAAELAAAEQLERSADAHDAAARTLDFAAKDARDDFQADTHMHVAEAHRAAARQDRELADRYRGQAEYCDTE
jgi:hypothetical protein